MLHVYHYKLVYLLHALSPLVPSDTLTVGPTADLPLCAVWVQ